MIDDRVRVYEQSPLLKVVGDTIRPGGLALTDRALEFCALPIGARVLDVGCGPAASIEHLRVKHQLNVVGLDPLEMFLRLGLRRDPSLQLIQSPGEHLPIAAGQFEAVLTECSVSVMRNSDRALAEFWRVLRSSGYLILSDIYARNPAGVAALQQLPIDSCLCGARPQSEIIDRVEKHGFEVKLWEDHTKALNVFAAQLIWSNGSLQQFWGRTTSQTDTMDVQMAIAQAKPGYYLLIAEKTDR
jgi:ubiquinone/menaquinone biosynthesis C-methylase UbiE